MFGSTGCPSTWQLHIDLWKNFILKSLELFAVGGGGVEIWKFGHVIDLVICNVSLKSRVHRPHLKFLMTSLQTMYTLFADSQLSSCSCLFPLILTLDREVNDRNS